MYINALSLQKDAARLASKIRGYMQYHQLKYDWIIIIARWWLHLWYYLAAKLKIRNIKVLSIETPHSWNEWYTIHSDIHTQKEHHYLVVDDLIDSGETIKFIDQRYNNINFDIAVLYCKEWSNNPIPNSTRKIFINEMTPSNERIDFYYEK